MKYSEKIRVGKKFVIVIPKRIRRKLGIKEGDILEAKVVGNKIVIEVTKSDPFRVLERVIGTPYKEEKEEKKAERWLMNAGS